MIDRIRNFLSIFISQEPLRIVFIKFLLCKLKFIPYKFRLKLNAVKRPHYGYCLYKAAELAKLLGYNKISAIEFGVAGGNGLINLEYHANEIEKNTGVEIEIFGFDTGTGLPEPKDYRDLLYHWKEGFFRLDYQKLKGKLKKSKLVLGNIEETKTNFFEKYKPAPIGAVFNDMDFYSSTKESLSMFNNDNLQYFLPRVYFYFDDIIGKETELYCSHTGQRLAIKEFNEENKDFKLSKAYYLICKTYIQGWYHQIYILHIFNHPKYCEFISKSN
jgi:hypothetical protein